MCWTATQRLRSLGGAPTGEAARRLRARRSVVRPEKSIGAREPRFVARISELSEATAFYAASFAADPLGTADTLLAWRDALVEAGWLGGEIPDAGVRIAAMARLERAGDPVPPGDADRLDPGPFVFSARTSQHDVPNALAGAPGAAVSTFLRYARSVASHPGVREGNFAGSAETPASSAELGEGVRALYK